MSGSRIYGRRFAPLEGGGRVGSGDRFESRVGCAGTWKVAFLMVDATPKRRMCDVCEVKTWSLVRGMMSES